MPNYNNTERPGLGAFCTSFIEPGELMDITKYNSDGSTTVIATSAALATGDGGFVTGTVIFANAFDGLTATPTNFTATAIPTQSSTPVTKTTASLKSTTPSATPTSGSPARKVANSSLLLCFIAFIAFAQLSF